MDKVCIIGGGASALMCASFAKGDITIYEKADKFGKKILATGNGRCNLTNTYMNKYSYNQNIENFLKKFNVDQTLHFFKNIGLETYADEEGRVYPISNTATSVLSVLKNYINLKQNIKINTEKCVKNVNFIKNKFKVVFEDDTYCIYDKVVVASGNNTDLSIYNEMGIRFLNFMPSLCSLKTKKHKNLSGIRVGNVLVSCNELNFKEIGEILFKEDGISGIVIFNLSAFMARKRKYNYEINFDFLPNASINDLKQMIYERVKNLYNYGTDEFFSGLFHKQLGYEILKRSGVGLDRMVNSLSEIEITNICENIKNFKINVLGYLDNNQVCSGGVLLSELDNNLQSKKLNGLYFIGEVCDVDGVCGGYNLQWAWTSGKIVGDNL